MYLKTAIILVFLALIVGCSTQTEEPKITAKSKAIKVTLQQVLPKKFEHHFDVSGIIKAEQEAFISPEMSGQIRKIHVKEGDKVTKGQLLLELNTNVAESGIAEVKTALSLANIMYEKQERLWKQKIGSEIDYLQAKNQVESLEKKLETMKSQKNMGLVYAPFSGIVDKIYVKKGELASPGMRTMILVNLELIDIFADVSEAYIAKIKKGDTVMVRIPAYDTLFYNVPVHRIGNVINQDNRSFEVNIKLTNKDHKLKPNMVVIVQINDYVNDSAIVVPANIVKHEMNKAFLFIAKQTDSTLTAKKKYVKTGVTYDNNTEIISGLNINDKVIIRGYNKVSEGTIITE